MGSTHGPKLTYQLRPLSWHTPRTRGPLSECRLPEALQPHLSPAPSCLYSDLTLSTARRALL